ncbi:MAG: hypothetical protein ABNH16_07130 [Thalassolituus sp.]|jgi:hypothetical protein
MKNQQLKVFEENGVLSISIGVNTLRHACEIGRRYGTGEIEITDEKLFLENLINEIEKEDEDGSTLAHVMFDSAVTSMLENGEEGVDLLEDE